MSGPGAEAAGGRSRLGPFPLATGISARNAATLMVGTFSTIMFVTFLSFVTPYLLNVLEVPTQRQGSLSGLMVSLQEGVVIALGAVVGALSDRMGRRPVLVAGLLVMAATFVGYPLVSSEAGLVAVRLVYAVGLAAAAVMLSTCIAEYIDNSARGRWMGTIGICNGLGVVVAATVLAKLPERLSRSGFDDLAALQVTFAGAACLLVALAVLQRRGLAASGGAQRQARGSLAQQTAMGVTCARRNPRVALGYLTGFAGRGDLVIITTFVSLWVVQAGIAAGMTPAAATARAGMVFGLSQGVGLVAALVMGLVLDRVPRLLGVGLAFALAAAGYLAVALVGDPLGQGMLVAVVLAGIGEACAVVSAGVLIGQEAPRDARGAVLGTYSLAGAAGMVCLTFAGGLLFDRAGPGAPFALMAVTNAAVVLAAVAVHRRSSAPAPVARDSA